MESPGRLYIEPSSLCNLNCKMCFRNSWIDEKCGVMSRDTWAHILVSLKQDPKPESVMFAGMGEPLTHPQIFEMIKDIASLGIKPELLTNGSLLSHGCAEALLECGLGALWVSVDGFERKSYEQIQRGAQFDRLTDSLKYFSGIKAHCRLGITFVVMKENIGELDRLNGFADSICADMINLSFAVPSSPLSKCDSVYESGIPIGKMKRLKKNETEKVQNHCPFVEDNVCFIKWDGEISPCMQLLHSSYTYLFEEKRRSDFCSFGNVRGTSINEAWKSSDYADFRKHVKNFEFPDCTLCDGCDDRLENLHDCMFNTFPTCGACLWAQGIARCP